MFLTLLQHRQRPFHRPWNEEKSHHRKLMNVNAVRKKTILALPTTVPPPLISVCLPGNTNIVYNLPKIWTDALWLSHITRDRRFRRRSRCRGGAGRRRRRAAAAAAAAWRGRKSRSRVQRDDSFGSFDLVGLAIIIPTQIFNIVGVLVVIIHFFFMLICSIVFVVRFLCGSEGWNGLGNHNCNWKNARSLCF